MSPTFEPNRPVIVDECIDALATMLDKDEPLDAEWAASALGPLGLGGDWEANQTALSALKRGLTESRSASCRRECAVSLSKMIWHVDGHFPTVLNIDHATLLVNDLARALESEADDMVCLAIIHAICTHAPANYDVAHSALRSFQEEGRSPCVAELVQQTLADLEHESL